MVRRAAYVHGFLRLLARALLHQRRAPPSNSPCCSIAPSLQANFAYIQGANKPGVKIPMTAPVVSRNPGGQNTWMISFFTPQSIYSNVTSVPTPTSAGMAIDAMPLSTFAIAEFGGDATEAEFKLATSQLKEALAADGVKLADASDPWAEVSVGVGRAAPPKHGHDASPCHFLVLHAPLATTLTYPQPSPYAHSLGMV